MEAHTLKMGSKFTYGGKIYTVRNRSVITTEELSLEHGYIIRPIPYRMAMIVGAPHDPDSVIVHLDGTALIEPQEEAVGQSDQIGQTGPIGVPGVTPSAPPSGSFAPPPPLYPPLYETVTASSSSSPATTRAPLQEDTRQWAATPLADTPPRAPYPSGARATLRTSWYDGLMTRIKGVAREIAREPGGFICAVMVGTPVFAMCAMITRGPGVSPARHCGNCGRSNCPTLR